MGCPTAAVGAGLGPGDSGEQSAPCKTRCGVSATGIEATGLYDEATAVVVTAFQRHFRQARVDGRADRSTIAAVHALLTARGGKLV